MKFQYSIRSLLFVTFLASVCMSFFGYHYRLVRHRLHAMSQIESDSGFVTFRGDNGGLVFEVTDRVRRRCRVDEIYLANSQPKERTLELLPALNEVSFISFNSSGFSDSHVGYLDELKNLRRLQLNGTLIGKVGLEHLAKRHRLTMLTLNDTSIDDGAVDALASMKTLKKLYLCKTHLTDAGLSRLQTELPDCEVAGSRRIVKQ